MEIHILQSGETIGPFSETEVRQFLGEGRIAPSDLGAYAGMENWQSLDQLLAQSPPSDPENLVPTEPPTPLTETTSLPEPSPTTPENLAPTEPPTPLTETTSLPELSPSVPEASSDPQPSSTAPVAPVPTPQPNPSMPNNASTTLEPPLAAHSTGMLPVLSLTSSQRTKRKLNKIVIQPILPLNASAVATSTSAIPWKKPRTGKTALTMEPLRPTTSLPSISGTGPLTRERKTGRTLLRTGQLSLGDFSEKSIVSPPALPPALPTAPAQITNVSQPPPLPPLAAERALPEAQDETPVAESLANKIPPYLLYAGAALAFILTCVLVILVYLTLTHKDAPTEAQPAVSINAAPVPSQPAAATPDLVPKTAADFRDRGLARQAKGDLDGAILDFNEALTLDPNNVDVFYRRGLARQAKNDLAGALADYTSVIGLDPKQANAFSNRGFVKQAQGDLDGALADYAQALLINPKIPVAYYNEGLIKVQKGDLDGAIAAYNQALDLDPKMAIAYYNRGNAKNSEGNLDGAIADYTQALVLNPSIALAYCNRGFARQSKGDSDGALADYAHALALNPKMAVALYNRGLIKVQKGDLDGAIADSSQAIDLDPKNGQAYCNRGLALMGKGNLDDAMSDLRKFVELVPRDSGADSARLYLWLIATEENPKGTADQDLSTSLLNDWNSTPEDLTSKIGAFLLGHINENALIADAASPDPGREPGQYCKVWYFAAMKRLLAGDTKHAITDFQKTVATQQNNYCEYIFAQAELQRLGQSLPIPAKAEASQ